MPVPKPDEESVFHAARRLPTPESRQTYVERACGDDRELRNRVEALLRAHDEVPGFLETPPVERRRPDETPIIEGPGSVIGPYRLLEEIGEGGFGIVFLAEQQHPVRRQVALKVIKPGMDTRQVIARFEAERQALALMEHPNIARILDGGETSTGRPYFVMELVRGVPVTEYCDRHRLSLTRRLELFAGICHAVQHAHQKGIVHRDLKPSNVLVAAQDGAPIVKVIDFGVAKALAQPLTDKTLFTLQMMGTPLYMSPEQAEGSRLDVDTRSDIYTLGVLLFELLTGVTPFDRARFETGTLDALRWMIREEEPARPSARVQALGEAAATAAAARRTAPDRLVRRLRGELDWIAMKCLEKDRQRRYPSANELALDVRRFLDGEAVEAGPASLRYRAWKVAKRHRALIAAAAAFAALLVAGSVVSVGMAFRATRSATSERLAKESAQKRLGQVERGIRLLGSIFEDLNPRLEEKEDKPLGAILGERLEQAARQLEGETVGDPEAVARLQQTLAVSLMGLGHAEQAIVPLQKARATLSAALGPEHPDVLVSMRRLGVAYREAQNLEAALPLLDECLRLTSATLGPDHPETYACMNALAMGWRAAGRLDLALPLLEQAVERDRSRHGTDHPETIANMANLGWSYRLAGKLELALPLLQEAFALSQAKRGPDHPATVTIMGHLANAFRAAGKYDLALPLLEKALEVRTAKLGPDHPRTIISRNNLGMAYNEAGKHDRAIQILEETLRLGRARLGPDHPEVLATMNNLALAWRAAGKPEPAAALFEELLELCRARLGPDHPKTLIALQNVAVGHHLAGKEKEALTLLEEAAAGLVKLRFEHEYTERIMNALITCLEKLGERERAERWRRKWRAAVPVKAREEPAGEKSRPR
jgi:serine/threonine protein kinase